ncbi:hypothetical protein [Lysinibacillus pakistanensis]|uniref:hypothetical protein n=1 Tax=Lysinibacillus pakistanensis TaxID=759811 RepID=UPI003D2DF559
MAKQTPNYGLTKSDLEEFYDVEVQNSNMDIIDNELKILDEGKASSAELTSLEQTVTEYFEHTTNYIEVNLLMNQSIPTTEYVRLIFNNKVTDNPNLFDLLPDGKIKIKKKGRYLIQGQVAFGANGTGRRILNIFVEKAGSTLISVAKSTSLPFADNLSDRKQISRLINLNANDTIYFSVYQTVTDGLPLLVSNEETYLTVGMV